MEVGAAVLERVYVCIKEWDAVALEPVAKAGEKEKVGKAG